MIDAFTFYLGVYFGTLVLGLTVILPCFVAVGSYVLDALQHYTSQFFEGDE